jgi:hypothetical protein
MFFCFATEKQQICHLDRSVPGFPTSLRLATTTHAALRKERRRNLISVTKLDRKSGGAEWRDLRFLLILTQTQGINAGQGSYQE